MQNRTTGLGRLWDRLVHSITTKIVLVALVVVFIPVYWLNREAVTFFDLFNRQALERNMRNYAVMVGSQYRQLLSHGNLLSPENSAHLEKQLCDYDRRMNIHIRILNLQGDVLLDSRDRTETNLIHMKEVRQSLSGGYAMRNALTPDRQFMNYYLAWPVKSEDLKQMIAVVHLVQDTNPVILAIQRMIRRQQIATWIALLAATLIAVLLANGITRSLSRLTQSALAFAHKDTRFKCRIKSKDEIGQLYDALQLMASEINDRNSYNREFVDALQHEYIGALAGIKGAVDNLNDGAKDDPEYRDRFIETISLQTQRMLNLIKQLNALSQLGVESLRDRKKKVDLSKMAESAVQYIEDACRKSHAGIEITSDPAVVEFSVVPELMTLVVVNLVNNAMRHAPVDGLIRIEIRQDSQTTTLTVGDNGDGISEGDLPHIFERFFTTVPKNKVDSRGAGLGLGLAIVKQIVEAHEGTISCISQKGQGAAFKLVFLNK